jgi:hypothetical protein
VPLATQCTDVATAKGWAWRWTGWASWSLSPAVLALCACTVVVDVVTSWLGGPSVTVGRAFFTPAFPLACVTVAVFGVRRIGFDARAGAAWREFLLLGAPTTLVAVLLYSVTTAQLRDAEGVVFAVMGEELVYRFAALLLFGACFAHLAGRDWRDTARWGTGPAMGAVVAAAVLFTVLPGHVHQMRGVTDVSPFVSVAVLLGYVAMRTGSLVPGFLVHVTVDLSVLAFLDGRLATPERMVVGAGALLGLVLGCLLAGRRLGLRRRMPRVIDLREVAVGVDA